VLSAGPVDGGSSQLVALVSGNARTGGLRDGDARLTVLADPDPTGTDERPIPVDQTHMSVVVGGTVRVKWLRPGGPPATRAAHLATHLAHVGFPAIPRPVAVAWRVVDGAEIPVAFVEDYLPSAVDGWQWCPDAALDGDTEFPARLGGLAASLHLALATPSPIVPEPVATAPPARIAEWHRAAGEALDAAVAAAGSLDGVREVLADRRDRMRAVIDRLGTVTGTPVQPVHGDLHVGQILRWEGGLAVVDFDGSPVAPDPGAPEPAARDLAQLLTSLDHVARVAERRAGRPGGRLAGWAREARRACRSGYAAALAATGAGHLLDERLLPPFMVEQECREILYAARHLPRWAHAPAGTLRAWWPDPSVGTGEDPPWT